MSVFNAPKFLDSETNVKWYHMGCDSFSNPKLLRSRYWNRYNTITIPLLDTDDFYSDALAAARESQSREELEKLLDEKHKQRRQELEDLMKEIGEKYISESSRDRAGRSVAFNGSLASLVRFISGSVFGWDDKSNTSPEPESNEDADSLPLPETQRDDLAMFRGDEIDNEDYGLGIDDNAHYNITELSETDTESNRPTAAESTKSPSHIEQLRSLWTVNSAGQTVRVGSRVDISAEETAATQSSLQTPEYKPQPANSTAFPSPDPSVASSSYNHRKPSPSPSLPDTIADQDEGAISTKINEPDLPATPVTEASSSKSLSPPNKPHIRDITLELTTERKDGLVIGPDNTLIPTTESIDLKTGSDSIIRPNSPPTSARKRRRAEYQDDDSPDVQRSNKRRVSGV